jgi:hypothetical protein
MRSTGAATRSRASSSAPRCDRLGGDVLAYEEVVERFDTVMDWLARTCVSGVSAMPFIIGIAIGAHAALLTPVGTTVNLIVMAPGG